MTKWEYAATVAASLAHLLVFQQDGVGLTLFDTEIRKQLPVSSNRASLARLATEIESNTPKNKTDVKMLLSQVAASIPRRGMVVILSDLLTNVDEFIEGLQRFRHHQHDVLVLHILDHDELEFPFADRTLFEGMEEIDQEVLTDPQSLRHSYLEGLEAFISKLRRACLNQKTDYSLISTAEGIDVALTTFLSSRMHRQRARA